MEKLWAPIDKGLSEIGRFVLLRPLFSGLMLFVAAVLTVVVNHAHDFFTNEPMTVALMPLVAADKGLVVAAAEKEIPALVPSIDSNAVKVQPAKKLASDPTKNKTPVKKDDRTPQIPSLSYVSGEVKRSLISDAKKAGLSSQMANQLAAILGSTAVKTGDRFSVLYEEKGSGKKSKGARIVAAQLNHKGKVLQLIRFTDPKGHTDYYTPSGESLRGEALLRHPVQYSHISSHFAHRRFDPILRFVRPHLGVDYAAPHGTPIKAAGDGVVMAAGYRGGYGNAVIIKHGDKYSTLYAHLSKFPSQLKTGAFVQKGQTIGYVGRTGFATGTHLHYEIHVNDVPQNPLTVALPHNSIPSAHRARFMAQAKTLLAQLKSSQPVKLAQKADSIKRF